MRAWSRWLRRRNAPKIVTASGLVPYIGVKGAFYTDNTRTTTKYAEHTFPVSSFYSEPHGPPSWADHQTHLTMIERGAGKVLALPLWAWWWAFAPAGPLEYWVEWRESDA